MNLYKEIEQAIRQHEEILYVDDSVREDDIRHAIRWVMCDNPDIFWFVHQYHFEQDKREYPNFQTSDNSDAICQSSDKFDLCWLEIAAQSDYVQKERSQALGRAFPQVKPQQAAKLSIYPMRIEPRAELPSDMKDNYHFGEI